MKKKIIFVSTAMTAPYVLKKIKAFRAQGYDTKLYAYNRGDDYERIENQWLGDVVDLGHLNSGRGYLKKLLLHIKSLKMVFRENKNEDSLFFLFMFDLALINLLFFKKKIVYHISDLTYAKVKCYGIVSIFRMIDRHIVKRSYLTIVTSKGFSQFLFPEGDVYNKIVEMPNLLQENNPYIRKPANPILTNDSLRFGFVGLSRYESPVRIAKVIGDKFPNHSFSFYGNGVPELMDKIGNLSATYNNIFSYGRFNSSTDLDAIYSNIDILICCYDTTNTNVKLAEPNKLYEAIFFNKPIVVSDGTYLGEKVMGLGVGFILDAEDEVKIESFIRELKLEDINKAIINCEKKRTSSLIESGERVVKIIEDRVLRIA